MSPAITRRSLVQAAGAAIGAAAVGVAAPALAGPEPRLDAALLDLIERHAEALVEMHRAEVASDRAFAASLAARPSRPDALRWREDDFPRTGLGAALSDDDGRPNDGRWYGEKAVAWMRPRPASTWFGGHLSPDRAGDEARRTEIVQAWDGHMAARWAVEVRTGYAAACEASDAASGLVVDLAAEIAVSRPQTLLGLRALAAWLGRQVEADDVHDDFLKLFAATVAGFGEVET